MGEVYRAHDSRLGRDVAIKILPAAWTADPDRVARFEREARVLAALNHPHIGSIYGLEDATADSGGRLVALVLELVEGDTLADRIARPPQTGLPVGEALEMARQIAEALDAAHERGIVHRDLKPANVKITPDGRIKVLDFGLAKTVEGPAQSDTPTISPTSFGGAFIGTPSYMSPEQARGSLVDKRADIWAFGCVLYELLTGRLAFPGTTVADTVVAILQRDPDWSVLPASTPPSVRRLLQRCLRRDPRQRLRDIGDVRDDLAGTPGDAAEPARSGTPRRPVQFQRLTDFVGINESPAVSPDGRFVAYVRLMGARRQIWLQLVAGGPPLQLTHDDADHQEPRWAPDSSSLIYYTPPTSPDDDGTIWEISALGGHPRPVISALAAGDISHAGDRIAAFQFIEGRTELVTTGRDGSDVRVVSVETAAIMVSTPRWSPDDRELAFHRTFLINFDERLLRVAVDGRGRAEVVRTRNIKGLSWLPDGSGFVYSSPEGSTIPYPAAYNLYIVSRDGTGVRPVTYGDVSYVHPDVHVSGKLAACRTRQTSDIWRIPVDGTPTANAQNAERITRQSGQVQTPSASPDGRELVFLSDHGGHANLWACRADGTQARQITFERDPHVSVGVPQWSPGGRHISFVVSRNVIELWLMGPDGRGQRQFMPGGFSATWSPDGEWLYYSVYVEDGNNRIEKRSVRTNEVVAIREGHRISAHAVRASALYFAAMSADGNNWEIRRASPEDGPSVVLGSVPMGRVPLSRLLLVFALSPDDRWLATAQLDGATTNIWMLPADGGPLHQVTDFGDRPTIIARQMWWAPDGRSIFAAVAETQSDVIVLDGLL
jgi:Tol biopolymer transport system component